MVKFILPDSSSEEEDTGDKSPPGKMNLPVQKAEAGSRTSHPERKGILKQVPSIRQHHNEVGSSRSGTFRVPPPQPSTSLSSPPSPRPLFSPQFDRKGARRVDKPDPFPLRGKQVDRVRKRTYNSARGRYVLYRTVPKNNTSTESEIRATKRLLSYPGLIRLLDYDGFESEARSNETSSRKIVWDYADLGTLQALLDQEQHSDGFPENFVWHVLLSLLKTALYLHTGYDFDTGVQHGNALSPPDSEDEFHTESSADSSTTDLAPTWQPVLHNLIQPWNISFYSHDEEDPPCTPRFPHVKLGNLSRVTLLPSRDYVTTHEDFPPLPSAIQTYFQAPEVAWQYQFGPHGTKSDLWSIAAVAVVMMGGIGGIAGQRKVKVWDDVAQRYIKVNAGSDEALYNETSRMIKAEKWRWTAADLNQRFPARYSLELRCFLERLLTVVPKQRLETLDAVIWASNYHVHWLRSVNALEDAAAETEMDIDELEEDFDTQRRIDLNRRIGSTTPLPTPSPREKAFAGRAPLDARVEQVELPNLDVELESDISSEDFNPGPPAHLLHELEVKQKAKRVIASSSSALA